jgi:hypothetical protein
MMTIGATSAEAASLAAWVATGSSTTVGFREFSMTVAIISRIEVENGRLLALSSICALDSSS